MKITFHSFHMGDVDDIEIYAGIPISKWQETEHGQWVMQNAHDLKWYTGPDKHGWGYDVSIRGELSDPKKITEYFLRWPQRDES